MNATPTAAEREKARQLAYSHQDFSPARVTAIAQAFADHRVALVAQYEAVADGLAAEAVERENRAANTPNTPAFAADRLRLASAARQQRNAAHRIRRVGR